jgi:hypothetical protein
MVTLNESKNFVHLCHSTYLLFIRKYEAFQNEETKIMNGATLLYGHLELLDTR